MKVLWPFGAAPRGEASSHLDTALAEDRCGKRSRKRRCESRQAGIRKASASEPLRKRRKTGDGIKTGVCVEPREESGGCPFIGQAVSGVKTARV
jgi:hypothetical protein